MFPSSMRREQAEAASDPLRGFGLKGVYAPATLD